MRRSTYGLSWFVLAVGVSLAGGRPVTGQEATPTSSCDAVDRILGQCGPPNASSHWLQAILEESIGGRSAERSVAHAFPPEPEGLIVAGANRKVSAGVSLPLSETAIAVSPQDPRRIAIGANTGAHNQPFQSMFVSVDGGKKFRASRLPTTTPTYFLQGDPSVTWTSSGQLWAATIEGQVAAGGLSLKGLAYRTTNAGATWVPMGAYSGTETLADRPTIWADTSATSAFKDSIYVTWHNGPVYVTRRRKGAANWAKPVRVSPREASGFGGDLKTDATGRIYVFWPDRTQMKIFVSTSSDGGVRFTPPVAVASITNHLFDLRVPPAGRNPGNYVTTAALSSAGTRWAFAAWMDRAAGATGPARIWFSSSRDGGATWSAPIHVAPRNDASEQFHAALTVDSQSGRLAVVYSDNAADPAGSKVHRSVATSNDFGVTWSPPRPITTVPSNVITEPEQHYGDYQSSFALGPRLWTVWTDRRTGAASSVWMAELRVTEAGAQAVEIGEPAAEPIRVSPDRTPAPPGIQLETQTEPYVAVSPKNPLHLAGAWQDGRFPGFGAAYLGFAFSNDGGATWKATRVPRLTQPQGGTHVAVTDPWVGIDTKGRIYVAALVQKTSGSTAIVVSSTADRGTTWRGPVVVHDTGAFDDKVALTIDTSATSAAKDTIYIGWSINHVPVVARSTDQGRTFGPAVALASGEFGLGVVLACADNGRLHAVWQGADESGTALRAVFSDDGGKTWSTATTVGRVVSAGVEGVRTGDGLPSLTTVGQRPFVVWQDGRFSPQEIVHVAFASSADGGRTWSAARRISSGPLAAANFLPAIARDRVGRLGVAFLSLRNDPARRWLADVYFVSSRDGGKTFSAARRLTPRTFDLREAAQSGGRAFVGDYFGLAGGTRFQTLFVAPWFPSVVDSHRRQPDVLAVSVDG